MTVHQKKNSSHLFYLLSFNYPCQIQKKKKIAYCINFFGFSVIDWDFKIPEAFIYLFIYLYSHLIFNYFLTRNTAGQGATRMSEGVLGEIKSNHCRLSFVKSPLFFA